MTRIYDLVASWPDDGDNPFPSRSEKLITRLRKYRDEHPEEFQFIDDWKNNLHSREIFEPIEDELKTICGVDLEPEMNLSDIPQLDYAVKRFFVQNASLGFSPTLLQWARSIGSSDVQPARDEEYTIEEPDYGNEVISEQMNEAVNEFANVLPDVNNDEAIVPENEMSTYNWAGNYTISYEELANLCLNQARKSYVSSKARNLEIEKVEMKRRNELCVAINKFFDLNEIATDLNAREQKLDKMTIAQLEVLHQQCEEKFDALKTKDLFKNVLATVEIVYDAWAHDGIKLTKNKSWVIDKGVFKQIQNALFDVRSVPGHACRRIIDKKHIHLPDEATVAIELLKILFKGSHIVSNDKKIIDELDDSDESTDESSDETSEDEELEEVEIE